MSERSDPVRLSELDAEKLGSALVRLVATCIAAGHDDLASTVRYISKGVEVTPETRFLFAVFTEHPDDLLSQDEAFTVTGMSITAALSEARLAQTHPRARLDVLGGLWCCLRAFQGDISLRWISATQSLQDSLRR